MTKLRLFAVPVLLMVTGLGVARPEEKRVVVPGQQPLTQDMIDDYCKYLAWRCGPTLASTAGAGRLEQMISNDWKGGDPHRRQAFLATLKWWREEFPKLSEKERKQPAAKSGMSSQNLERLRQSANMEAICLLMLQYTFDTRQQEILAISSIGAKGHEINMRIIDNLRPSGRYEYNPASGRYDRYVPN